MCANNNTIYKGKLQMQVRCGFYVWPGVRPKLLKAWFYLNNEKQKKHN